MDTDFGCALGRIEQMIRHAYWTSGSSGIVIGLSGGIDSAVAATMCCRAVGGERVLALILPSRVTLSDDISDAEEICTNLRMDSRILSIDPILDAFRGLPDFKESPSLVGNLMARIRMAILYYHANRDNRLVCGTSNRTEYLLGYCTKFGDNAADIQPILHLYKTEIYDLAKTMDIPKRVLEKAPSAGLWEGQRDEDEIGLTYPVIDASLKALVSSGWKSSTDTEEKVLRMVRKSEHKRLQPPSLFRVE